MLFSEYTGKPVCVCRSSENRKRTKCQMYIFNMVVLSVNPTSERDFWLPQKNISGGRLSKELTIRYYYNNKVEGSTVWVDPNRSNSLWTSENTSRHSNKSRVLHTWYVRLGGYIWARGGPSHFSLISNTDLYWNPNIYQGLSILLRMKTNGITHQENMGYYMNTLIYDVGFWWVHEF